MNNNNNEKNINLNNNNNNNSDNNNSDTLFEYDNFKNKYIKINLNKKVNKSNLDINNLFDKKNKYNNEKINCDDENDDFYKRKTFISINNNIIDNKNIIYNKIPHHIKKERNKEGLWGDYNVNWFNKSNNTLGLIDQTSSFYSINITNKSNNYKFNRKRKINTSVLPANPFDTVNEAREYFFFND
jgi:hypothetical protein